jgi:rhodanese-related sulfurtransferase
MRNKARWILLVLLAVLALALVACDGDGYDRQEDPAPTQAAAAPGTFTTVDVRQAHDALSNGNDAIIVDVRTAQEWAQTGVPVGATLIPLDEIAQRAGELPQDRPIYLICNSGNRSRVAADALVERGFTSVYNVDGGIQAWLRAELPTEPYTP